LSANRGSARVRNVANAWASLITSGDAAPELDFEAVVAADTRRLYWLALSILDDAGEAEDAAQETLFKAWRS
jgi:DNA-directed RNA polymerase specialized sigma24 family protein